MLDVRTAQTRLEDLLRDAVLYAMGRRLAPVASVAAMRQISTKGAGSGTKRTDDDLAVIVVASVVTKAYRWRQASTSADDGLDTLRPDDVEAAEPGRWLSWTSPARFVPVIGGNSYYLHELPTGPLERVIVLDKSMSEDEITGLLIGAVPAVVIEAAGDDPEDATLLTGFRYLNRYRFTISSISQNLRDRREAAQSSAVVPGSNTIDGFVKALLSGTSLSAIEIGIRNVEIGRGYNWTSDFDQRRVVRSREFTFFVSEGLPAAPNDYGAAQEVEVQAVLTDLDGKTAYDAENQITAGLYVPLGVGLTKTVAAGTARIAGTVVAFAGELHTFGAGKATYRDLLPNGTMVYLETDRGASTPPITATALRVGATETDGSGITGDRFMAITRSNFGPTYVYPL